ncbi:hypothetical protein [Chryseobacterium gossypii]|uniref:hypothetical protein n=1 Tax=Chryseobacterium gossypii TaxID=3231602 RepID=UPI0035244D74
MSKKDRRISEENDFMDDFEDWHSRKYSDEYRFKNKTPFFVKTPNYLMNGILLLMLPFLSLVVSIILDLGISFYLCFSLICIPGIYFIVKHFKLK